MRNLIAFVWMFLLCGHLLSQTRLFRQQGKYVGEVVTWFVRPAGDVNGDGVGDFVYTSQPKKNSSMVLSLFSGLDGKPLFPLFGGKPLTTVWEPEGIGDVDGDGFGDLVYFASTFNKTYEYWLAAYSPHLGKELYRYRFSTYFNFRVGHRFQTLEVMEDVDGDGVKEILLGTGYGGSGAALISGKTGKLIRYHRKVLGPIYDFGFTVRGIPDIDKDGVPDYLISDPNFGGPPRYKLSWGKVWLYSGKTGKELCAFELGSNFRGGFFGGEGLAALGDLNGDGWPDLGIQELDAWKYGRVWIYSGKEAAKGKAFTLTVLSGSFKKEALGLRLAPLGDWDGDGRDDFAAYAERWPGDHPKKDRYGLVHLYSGKTLKRFKTLQGQGNNGEGYGLILRPAGDLDGDGNVELLVGSDPRTINITKPEHFDIWTHKDLSLRTDRHLVSLSGIRLRTQTMRLDAGVKNAGRFYLLLGSLGGHKPGFRLGSLHVPLNPDAYFYWTATNGPNALFLRSSFGQLDAKGRGMARFVLPAGMPPSLRWMTLWHSYVVLDARGFSMASNAAPVLWSR